MDNNFRQTLRSPHTGNKHVVGNASEAARLRAQGYELVEENEAAGPAGEAPVATPEKPAEQKPPRGAARVPAAESATSESQTKA